MRSQAQSPAGKIETKDPRDSWHYPGAWPDWLESNVSERTCVECERKFYARGWCRYHYQVNWLAGTIEDRARSLVRPGATLDERLRNIGWTVTEAECWEWNGSRNRAGYGQLAQGTDRPIIASRAAHEAWVGPIGMLFVLHRCDNPPCINPSHLFLGTIGDNSDDMVRKQRSRNGERRPQHKLTDAEVDDIRRLYVKGGRLSQAAVGAMYGVSQGCVGLIVNGQRRQYPTHPIPTSPSR